MSTTEALRTRLDAMQTELYKLQVENRRLREEKPEQAQLLEVEEELAQTREENVRLAQQISEWSRSAEDEDMSGKQEQKWKETIARLEDKAGQRERQLDLYQMQLEGSCATLEAMTTRKTEAEQSASRATEKFYHAREHTELERLRAIADETRKWEERE